MPYYEHFIGENNQNRKKKNLKKIQISLLGLLEVTDYYQSTRGKFANLEAENIFKILKYPPNSTLVYMH